MAKRISKKTNRRKNLQEFIDSDYADLKFFKKMCKDDENLMIYTCLDETELLEYIDSIKNIESLDDKISFLVSNQPTMNASVERYNRCTESIANYLSGYIAYNAWKMSNSDGDSEDWESEFWLKYTKICAFYRTRWFFPQELKKPSTVEYSPVLYKEFIYICRMSITGDRKHKAFLATQNQNSSIFKLSLDCKIEDSDSSNEKSLSDVLEDTVRSSEITLSSTNLKTIIDNALKLCKKYNETPEIISQITSFYETQDPSDFDKKVVILGKLFLYKAGLVSPKVLCFIKNLASTYKIKYNISNDLLNEQLSTFKNKKHFKIKQSQDLIKDAGWETLISLKRGEL